MSISSEEPMAVLPIPIRKVISELERELLTTLKGVEAGRRSPIRHSGGSVLHRRGSEGAQRDDG
jgi:hypothetical protein